MTLPTNSFHKSGPGGNSVRLDDAALTQLLNDLDRNDGAGSAPGVRGFRYRNAGVPLRLGTGAAVFRVPTRTISSTFLTFIHGCYVYEGIACEMQLTTLHGTWNDVAGTVKSCTYVRPFAYEITVIFRQPIDPTNYSVEAAVHEVLVVDDCNLSLQIISAQLRALNASVSLAADGRQALEVSEQRPFDLILLDLNMPQLDGWNVITALRERGHLGRVVAISDSDDPQLREKCVQAGFDDFHRKPIDRPCLEGILRNLRREPVVSTLADDSAMTELIAQFVAELPQLSQGLSEAIRAGKTDAALGFLRRLRVHGAEFGFEPISRHAAELDALLRQNSDLRAASSQLRELYEICAMARSPSAKSARDTGSPDAPAEPDPPPAGAAGRGGQRT